VRRGACGAAAGNEVETGSERPQSADDPVEVRALAEVGGDQSYRSLFDSSLDGILLVAADTSIVDANQTACALLGRTHDELCTLRRYDIVPPGPEVERAVEERGRTGRSSGEVTFRRKDGTTFPGEFTSFILPHEDGAKRAFLI
jgi:PAS domain S-box-containing protein